jgi:CheY-like chemotaxis protein
MSGKTRFSQIPIDQVPTPGPHDTLDEKSTYKPIVMVVDDESIIADTLTEILVRSGYAAVAAYDGEEAFEKALMSPPELVIADVMLPGMSGIDLAIKIKSVFPDCHILLFSGQASTADLLASANKQGHRFAMLSKPVHPSQLLTHVSESFKSRRQNVVVRN